MTQTVRTVIRKNPDGAYELITNVRPDILCRMTQEEFEALIRGLELLRDAPANAANAPVCYFPEFTHRITG